jgi:hypothetical protein
VDAIQQAHPKLGTILKDPRDKLAYWKYEYWRKGIPAHQFRKERICDIMDIMDIKDAVDEKKRAIQEINSLYGDTPW